MTDSTSFRSPNGLPAEADVPLKTDDPREGLAENNEHLKAELEDLRLLYNALMEHGEAIEDQLAEKNRLLSETQSRLDDAINATSEGFCLFDADDRLVTANARFRNLFACPPGAPFDVGTPFEDILRHAIAAGQLMIDGNDEDVWIEERLARRTASSGPFTERFADARWCLVNERRTQDHGIVAVYSDITELKTREKELADKTAQMEQLSKQLAKYLSPQVYDSIFQGRQEVKIASSRKKLTVFFSDIADFTETADRLASEDLTHLLNQYLTEMSRIALNFGATIDKFVGDAILIFFGDPDTQGVRQDAVNCVRMAIAMQERMRELEGIWLQSGITRPLKCRMGIHTDFCTVGNFGSEDRLDYTIIGRGVNTAARLESAATPGDILISYETFLQVQDEIACEKAGEIQVKGLAYPLSTYTVLGDRATIGAPAVMDLEGISRQLDALCSLAPGELPAAERERLMQSLKTALATLDTGGGESTS
ncbi:hypothetical protein GCM10011316_32820 [Roseibium aquae]|uniref:Guanylate cyclase domain-containing protein n=1 Tax=Roseibium aquae TaxID=1323746 RepID=A0A916X315_9HYPH|nr:adenylate/guanylate cyclase domain-containing protein [Roseibium aquae]GGB58212.1 hypothetical protein GCM10011316_32820 [Roseibium aquae]